MTTVQIMQFDIAKQHEASIEEIIREATTLIQNASSVQSFTIGTELEDKNALQILIQDSDPANSTTTTELLNSLSTHSITPSTTFHLTFTNTPFTLSDLITAPVVEHAQSWFPLSEATPAFKQRIEQDFDKFTEIFKRESKGDIACGYGWVEEELDNEDVKGKKAASFVVARGWETFEDFKMSTNTESFKEAAPILYGWGAPHRMWFVVRRSGS